MRAWLCVLLLVPCAAAAPLSLYAHTGDDPSLSPVEPDGMQTNVPCLDVARWHAVAKGPTGMNGWVAWRGNASLEWYWAVQAPILGATTVVTVLGERLAELEVGRSPAMDLVPGSPGHERIGAWDVYRIDVPVEPTVAAFWQVTLEAETACAPVQVSGYTDPGHRSALHLEDAVGIERPDLVMEERENGSFVALYGRAMWRRDDIMINMTVDGPAAAQEGFANTYCCGYTHNDGHPIAVWDVQHTGPGNVSLHVAALSRLTGQSWSGSIQVQAAPPADAAEAPWPWAGAAVLAAAGLRRRATP